jgi:hypothetical protein
LAVVVQTAVLADDAADACLARLRDTASNATSVSAPARATGRHRIGASCNPHLVKCRIGVESGPVVRADPARLEQHIADDLARVAIRLPRPPKPCTLVGRPEVGSRAGATRVRFPSQRKDSS